MQQFTDPRQQRGLLIAATAKIVRKGDVWLVPAQTPRVARYTVSMVGESPHCTCPDHETRGVRCKHIYAVEYTIQRESNADGSATVTETLTVQTIKKTYRQDWRAYNAAQTGEKAKFLELLHDLCKGVPEVERAKTGRPRLALSDAIFAACFKVYSTVSARRFMSDLRDAEAKGWISKTPHFNSIFNYLDRPEVTPVLKALIAHSALPLKSIENDFAADSSGFTSSRFIRWFDHKYNVVRQEHDWVKLHLMCGVKTHIVTSVEIRDRNASDTKLLPPMLAETAKSFEVRHVLADRGYGSLSNYAAIEAIGATPYIAFKSIHTGRGGGLWAKMFHLFQYRREEFLRHYHQRSNVESTFSMIKAKFRDHVRSKSSVAMVNEVLCKIICHNICVLIQEAEELGVDVSLRQE